MSDKKLNVPVLLGTARKGRSSEVVAKFIVEHANMRDDMEAKLVDVAEMDFSDGEAYDFTDKNSGWQETMNAADALIIVVPEYNHGYPGSLKLALDMLMKEYRHKPVAIVPISMGGFGGTRVAENLLPVLREIGLVATFTTLNISNVKDAFDDDGKPKNEMLYKFADGFLDELFWMGTVLKWGRKNIADNKNK